MECRSTAFPRPTEARIRSLAKNSSVVTGKVCRAPGPADENGLFCRYPSPKITAVVVPVCNAFEVFRPQNEQAVTKAGC